MMAHKWQDLKHKYSAERKGQIEGLVQAEVKRLPLYGLRQARKLTQVQLANSLSVPQSSISKMERRSDMYLSTLRSYIKAMGGDLQIKAIFPDGEVQIDQLEQIDQ